MSIRAASWPMLIWTPWMKAISPKLQKLQFQFPREEKKLNKNSLKYCKKAAVMVCLFLLPSILSCSAIHGGTSKPIHADPWKFDEAAQKAYDLVLNLQVEEAYQLLPQP